MITMFNVVSVEVRADLNDVESSCGQMRNSAGMHVYKRSAPVLQTPGGRCTGSAEIARQGLAVLGYLVRRSTATVRSPIRYCDSQALAVSMAGRAAGIPV